ncbi:hypothetical protein EJ04DRAFT_561822 [Polyplosphaeria fusca]|uniref:TEA domain-containing protein n=1 Tax=Polyplosphaeria fusca TaxID=682080 RepID=A0A9P4R5P8_9PLEO|nr:hypothetical protein EJ04DRAFT_561822 [Polyplosphaeria fusca]
MQSRVLQERSGNRRHGYADGSASWKRESSPVENLYSHSLGGSYFTGNVAAQLGNEKSDAQIEHETKRLLSLLKRNDKYQKYRERQPQTKKEKEQKWPDNLEEAFFRALVRWPPMGRRKQMLAGQLRGRNELVADAIERDTGEPRSRKQVSSHIQVLKNILAGQHQLLVYMSTEDLGGRKSRHSSSQFGNLRSRHASQPSSKYEPSCQTGAKSWGTVSSQNHLAYPLGHECPFAIANFALWVTDKNGRPVHHLSKLADSPRLVDSDVTDTTSWYRQFPELKFHNTEDWRHREVLLCDATIKIMSEIKAESHLHVELDLNSAGDLSAYGTMQCRTQFYDKGVIAEQRDKADRPTKETRANFEFDRANNRALIPFGSKFWVTRMFNQTVKLKKAEDQEARRKIDIRNREELQYLTAAQDIYGIDDETGESHCLLTILWRFSQARSNDAGTMTWRMVNFMLEEEQSWARAEEMATQDLFASTVASSTSIYPSLPLDFGHQSFGSQPPHLDLEALCGTALEGMNDFSNPDSATAPSMATDYSQTHSLPSLAHSQDTALSHHHEYQDANEIDFGSGHINLCLEPAINLGAYESQGTCASTGAPLNPLASLEHTAHDNVFADFNIEDALASCYPTKPTWPYHDVVSRFEGMAEQTQSFLDQGTHAQDLAGHGVLRDGQMNQALWKLQTGFADDAIVGADARMKDQWPGHAILELIERDQRSRDDKSQAL